MSSLAMRHPERDVRWILVITLAGLALRVVAARGTLWIDEAWSAVFANQVGTALGVFQDINHDNNHHLNSLWLLTVGIGAPPMLARALSIAAGGAAIFIAGLIGLRRGSATGIITALLFALSPVLVTLGSEARGYAPMLLCLLVCLYQTDHALEGDAHPLLLAVFFYIGILFQLTIVFGACAIIGWYALTMWQRCGFVPALRETFRLFGLSFAALCAALLLIFGPTLRHGAEFTFGNYEPFSLPLFVNAVGALSGYSVGVPWHASDIPVLIAIALLAVLATWYAPRRAIFYQLAIIAFPLAFAAFRPMNSGLPRYHLLVGIALLLLLGELLGRLIDKGGWRRLAGGALLAAFAAGSVCANLDLLQTRRGDASEAIRIIASHPPGTATVLIERANGTAILRVAAAEQGYTLRYTMACPAQPFLFLDRFKGEKQPPAALPYCGATYRAIASAIARGMSGQNWTLYERVD